MSMLVHYSQFNYMYFFIFIKESKDYLTLIKDEGLKNL